MIARWTVKKPGEPQQAFDQAGAALAYAYSALKPGGYVIIAVADGGDYVLFQRDLRHRIQIVEEV